MRNRNYGSDTAILDTFVTIALVSLALFYIAFPLINPISKKADEAPIPKVDMMIVLEWDSKSPSDVDLWVKSPTDKIISFRNKSTAGMFLDRDDMGTITDKITLPDGTQKDVELNREVASIRGYTPGIYTVNVHFYRGYDTPEVKLELIQMQPYRIVTVNSKRLHRQGEEITILRFEVDSNGKIVRFDEDQDFFVNKLMTESPM